MTPEDKERFTENFDWFNQFFQDMRQLLKNIHKALKNELSYTIAHRGWYYEKSKSQPSLPPYWVTAISEDGFALQIFLILDISLLENNPYFINELSLVLVKHSRSDKSGYFNDYGMRVVQNKEIIIRREQNKFASGEISRSEGTQTKFQAFQVPLSAFTNGKEFQNVIQEKIVAVLRDMPVWE